MYTVGGRIKELRTNHLKSTYPRLSQERFGNMLGVTRNVIVNLERDVVKARSEFIDLICKIYGVNKDWLMEGAEPVFSDDSKNSNIDYLIDMYKKLSPSLQTHVLDHVQKLIEISKDKTG